MFSSLYGHSNISRSNFVGGNDNIETFIIVAVAVVEDFLLDPIIKITIRNLERYLRKSSFIDISNKIIDMP